MREAREAGTYDFSCQLTAGLKTVKRSPDYRRLHPQLLDPVPSDLWSAGHWGFFVFDMRAEPDQSPDQARMALFTVDLRDLTLTSVKVILADTEQSEATVEDLRLDEGARSLALPADW